MHADQIAFVTANTALAPVAFVPEIRLRQADEPIGLWELSEGEYHSDQPPPFWAFAWAGGQALARYLLDNPDTVAGRRVLDVATGSGLVAIAAARAGAVHVRAVDIDPLAVAAVGCNAEANAVSVEGVVADVIDGDGAGFDVVLAGDAFYSKAMSDRMTDFLRRVARRGGRVFAGDPERKFLRRELFALAATYEVPVPRVLEGVRVRRTSVWELPGRSGQPERQGR
ncbi:class I SAM-dependent methyltransferase [Rugosimonospora africana]|uniref:class I SAM-dependent methyltransferase n=1 Tax=Rugosimonospora africana TaxID=556532 RepID=UPI001EF2ADCD|nr:50S ribosomal protein L11 methyltransferase [Rugosimonospora africana]